MVADLSSLFKTYMGRINSMDVALLVVVVFPLLQRGIEGDLTRVKSVPALEKSPLSPLYKGGNPTFWPTPSITR